MCDKSEVYLQNEIENYSVTTLNVDLLIKFFLKFQNNVTSTTTVALIELTMSVSRICYVHCLFDMIEGSIH